MKTTAWVFCVISFLMFFNGTGEANSFPFRAVNPGDPLPSVSLTENNSQQQISLQDYRDKPLLIVFWGADIPTKKKRSLKTLKIIKKLQPFLAQRQFTILSVDAQGDRHDVVDGVMQEAALDLPVYTDAGRKAYGSLGIFVMPAVMVVDKDGKVAAGMGYSRDLKKRLQGEIEVMLGEKTRAQIEDELRPKMVEKSKAEKDSHRHFNMAMTMIARGQPGVAIREMKKAIQYNPQMGKAYTQLGCLYIDDGKMDKAREALVKGAELDADSIDLQICQSRIKAADGEVDDAIDDLRFLLLRNSRNPTLHYVLGSFFEKQGDIAQAAKEYRKAYQLLEKKARKEQ